MIKKCIVKYDDLEKPIEVVEVKEFADVKVLEDFKAKCLINKQAYKQRLQEKAENERLEKQKVADDINALQNEIIALKSVISHLFGYAELEEEQIKETLGVEEHD